MAVVLGGWFVVAASCCFEAEVKFCFNTVPPIMPVAVAMLVAKKERLVFLFIGICSLSSFIVLTEVEEESLPGN